MQELLCFYVPCENKEKAQLLIVSLIDQRLIACGNIVAAESHFIWESALCTGSESIAIMKTAIRKEEQVEDTIKAIHDYELPCIARWTIRVNNSYAEWVEEMISRS